MKKAGETTRSFRYDLNQIELIDRVPAKLWTEVHNTVLEAVIKTIPKKKKCKTAKWLSKKALQIAEKRREVKGKKQNKNDYRSLQKKLEIPREHFMKIWA